MTKKEYPLFVGPSDLARKSYSEFTSREADRYFEYITQNMDNRIHILLDYFNETLDGAPGDVLMRIGEKAYEIIRDPMLSSPNPHESCGELIKLTAMGITIAADMGLLMAKFLVDSCKPIVKWSIVRRSPCHDDCNKPVLIGFGPLVTIDPIQRSVSNMSWILIKGAAQWKDTYNCLKSKGVDPNYPERCKEPKKTQKG